MRRSQTEQKMYVICRATDDLGYRIHISDDPAEISMERFAPSLRNERFPRLRAEDNMIVQ